MVARLVFRRAPQLHGHPVPGDCRRLRLARRVAIVGLVAGAGWSTACGTSTPTTAPPTPRNVVSASPSLAFSPAELTIAVGDSVVWTFGGLPHTVVFRRGNSGGDDDAPPADIGSTTSGSVTRVFRSRGSYPYHCTLHPGMTGEVRVR